jgi:hypothetical protein
MRKLIVTALVALMVVFAAGCGTTAKGPGTNQAPNMNSPNAAGRETHANTSPTHLASAKFVLHAGLAFGAFHRYIYTPYKAGKFSGGLFHHKLATAKAALAAAFAYHETRLALDDARQSKVLRKLLSPLLALQTKLSTLRDGLRHGSADPSAIQSTQSAAGTLDAQSAAAGERIKDQRPPSLGG